MFKKLIHSLKIARLPEAPRPGLGGMASHARSHLARLIVILNLFQDPGSSGLRIKSAMTKGLRVLGKFKFLQRILFPLKRLSKRNRRIVISLIVLLIIPAVIYSFSHILKAEAAWFDTNFSFRQRVDVTNAGSAQTDFQVSFTLNTDTLYDNGKLRSDCYDIRVTDVNGKLLPFWIETMATACGNGQTAQTIWVKVPSISTTGNTLYVYYGNPGAASASNGDNVFELFDDFSGSSVNSSKWTSGTTNATTGTDWSVSGGNLNGGNQNRYLQSVKTFTGNYAAQSRSYTTTDNVNGFSTAGFWASTSNSFGILDHDNTSYYRNDSGWVQFVFDGTGQWSRNIATVSGTTASYSRIGETSGSATATGITNSGISGEGVRLGARYDSGNFDQNYVATWDWVFVRKAATANPVAAAPTNEENGPDPVAYWKFDEGTGTTAKDSSSNKYNGALGGSTLPSWKAESECVSGKCLFFDSSNTANNPKVTLNESSTTKTNILGDVTTSLWFKPVTGYNTTSQAILRNGNGADLVYSVFYDPVNQRPYFHWYDGAFGSVTASSNTAPLNKWTHVEIVRSGTNLSFYINGKLDSTSTVTAPTVSAGQLTIGQTNNDGVGQDYHGFIDDVKIYGYARSAAQIKADYNSRGGSGGNVLGAEDNKALSQGLVGHWKMNEATWSGTLNEVLDSSGNGNNGQAGGATNAKAYPAPAKFGNGGFFDGVDDYVDAGSGSSLRPSQTVTIGAWFKTTSSSSQAIISVYPGYRIMISSNVVYAVVNQNSGAGGVTDAWFNIGTVSSNTWNHVVLTIDKKNGIAKGYLNGDFKSSAAISTVDLAYQYISTIGVLKTSIYGDYFSGLIDESRVYNRVLSPVEIEQLYNFAPGPVAYYDFEEGSGGSVNDTSGNASTGTWNGTGSHWTQGKYGKAGNFNGTNNEVQVPAASSIDSLAYGDFSVSAWIRMTGHTTNSSDPHWRSRIIEKRRSSAPTTGWIFSINDNKALSFGTVDENGSDGGSISTNDSVILNKWQYVSAVYSSSSKTVKLYIDGKETPYSSQTVGNGLNFSDSDKYLSIGNASTGETRYFNGQIDEAKIYNYARTSGQIVSDMNASHPAPGSPVGSALVHLKFDDGRGNWASNSGNIKRDGDAGLYNMASPATTNSGWSQHGKFGKALSFDGINDFVDLGNPSSLSFASSDFTLSAWVKSPLTGDPQVISSRVYDGTSGGYQLRYYPTGTVRFLVGNGTTGIQYETTGTLAANQWHHIVVTVARGGKIRIYGDGVKMFEVDDTVGGSYANSTNVSIGKTSSTYFPGLIDEVKIYNSALTASQVKLEYNRGSSMVLGSLSDTSQLTGGSVASNSASAEYCVPGASDTCSPPIGRWDFEEGQGTQVNDRSGNGNTGTWNGTGNHWTKGKFGKSGMLDGSTDYVSVDHNSSLNLNGSFTIGFWYNKTSNLNSYPGFILKGNAGTANGYIIFWDPANGNTWFKRNNDQRALFTDNSLNTWHYLTITHDSSAQTLKAYKDGVLVSTVNSITYPTNSDSGVLSLGTADQKGNVKLDDFRIYSYARTAAQVAWDYNKGAPVGWWKMDECQGSTVNDSSGNRNNGTITIGGSGTSSVGTCTTASTAWYDGVSGRNNYSLKLDGTDDYISRSSTTGDSLDPLNGVTLSAWIYPTIAQAGQIMSRNGPYLFFRNANGTLGLWIVGGGAWDNFNTTETTPLNSWSHVGASYDGTTMKIYINGRLSSSKVHSTTGTLEQSTRTFWIGYGDPGAQNYFAGKIDDVRVYNYPLTPVQIKTALNNGAVTFGPATGAP